MLLAGDWAAKTEHFSRCPWETRAMLHLRARGFAPLTVRREDMKKLLLATRGKVFTLQNVEHLIACTRLGEFQTRNGA